VVRVHGALIAGAPIATRTDRVFRIELPRRAKRVVGVVVLA